MTKSQKAYANKTIATIMCYIVMIIVLLILAIPIFFMVISMFKSKNEIFSIDFHVFPHVWSTENFARLFYLQYTTIGVNFFQSLAMTLLVAAISMILSLAINMMAGFAFARVDFPFKKVLWPLVLITMFIPGITILLTSISVVSKLGMMNTIFVLIIPGLANAYNIFFFKQFYSGFPKDYDEAARIDGCNTFQIFTRVYLKNSKTPMVIIGAGTFMGYFNSYLWPTLTLTEAHSPLTQIMTLIRSLFNDASQLGYGAVLAAAFIAMIPALIVFFIVQRYIKDGIALAGVK